jgi:uncharacterized protein (DUF488 family)
MKLFTIGFTKKTAQKFFGLLRGSGARRVVDVRLNNVSQLAGFAKKDDLAFFLKEVAEMEYVHVPELAPTQEMLDAYKKEKGDWRHYEQPHQCHRRLVAEYLQQHWGDVDVKHLT